MDQRKNFSAAIEAIFNAYPEEKQKEFREILGNLEESLKSQYTGRPEALNLTAQDMSDKAVLMGVPADFADLSIRPIYSRVRTHFIDNIPGAEAAS